MNTHSRFAVLSSEIDLDSAHKIKSAPKKDKIKKEKKSKENDNIKSKNIIKQTNPAAKEKKETSDLQALAFGFERPKNAKKKTVSNGVGNKEKAPQVQNNPTKKGKGTSITGKGTSLTNHDEDWKKRDEEFVKAQNENSLREAILQSKLEFEQKKKEDNLNKKNSAKSENSISSAKGTSKSRKKKEKPLTISLSQFNSMETKDLQNLKASEKNGKVSEKTKENELVLVKDEKFFKDVDETTRKTLEMEDRHEQYKKFRSKTKSLNYETENKKLRSEIEKRDFEIQALRLEVDSLKTQMQAVKTRNKKLCEVISFSEMRSKGELIVELEKVTKGRDEFSEELSRLNAELEQERTKVSLLNSELKKIQGKKRNADTSSK